MPTIKAGEIAGEVSQKLFDSTQVRWPPEELLKELSNAQRSIVGRVRAAYAKNEIIDLVAGTKQSIPAGGEMFLKAIRNMGSDKNTPGIVPRRIPVSTMDNNSPDWHEHTPSATVKNVVYDLADPKTFYVHPPQPSSNRGSLQILYSASPPELTDENDVIGLDDTWKEELFHFVMARCLAKQSGEGDPEGASVYWKLFIEGVEAKKAGYQFASPAQFAEMLDK